MPRRTINLLTALLLVGFAASAQSVLTLDQAIASALEHNHDLYISALDAEQAENSATYGNAGMLPNVTASAAANYSNQNSNLEFATGQTQDVAGAESLSQNASLGVSQVLFAGGRIQRSYALLQKGAEVADLAQRQLLEGTIAQVWSQYLAIDLLQRSVATAEQSVAISKERYDKAKLTNSLGGSNSTDLLAAEVDLNRDQIDLMDLRTQLEQARNSFATFVGLEDDSFEVTQDGISALRFGASEAQALDQMMQSNSALLLAQTSLETALLQEKLQQATLFPSISANASYSYSESAAEAGFLTNSQQTGINAGVSLQYNLFSGFQSRTQRQNAKIDALKAERRLAQTKENLENTVKNALRVYDNAKAVATLEQTNALVAKQRFDKMEELYSLGKASSLELRQAQLAWLAAENGKYSAQFRAMNAEIALYQLMGAIGSDGSVNP